MFLIINEFSGRGQNDTEVVKQVACLFNEDLDFMEYLRIPVQVLVTPEAISN